MSCLCSVDRGCRPDYRGKVEFHSNLIVDAVGIVMRDDGERDEYAVIALADRIARSVGAERIRSQGNFARSGIAVVGAPGDHTRGVEALLDELGRNDEVEQAGAIVKLLDNHTSFLTTTVIARFAEGVDDERVANIATRHGLTPDGRINALGAVYRLRFAGPASYAVLDASNALADEAEVVYAEPDLIHTVEEDAVDPDCRPDGLPVPAAVGPLDHQHARRVAGAARPRREPYVRQPRRDHRRRRQRRGRNASRVRGQRLGRPPQALRCSTSPPWPRR